MRNLASIQYISALTPIAGADKIEVATVLGWQCVVAKADNFKVGDKVIYVEVDSILPEKPEFEFLRERKFRIKTIRLKGQVSQGIIFPLSLLKGRFYTVSQDVTEELGIRKYDPQGDLEQKLADEQTARQKNKIKRFLSRYGWFKKWFVKRQGFPSFIKKTDEDRIQLFPNICETHKGVTFIVTEKLDGQSATYFLVKKKGWFRATYEFGVCSRNLLLPKPDNSSYWTVAREKNMEDVLKSIIGNDDYVVVQGEIVGPGIQGNKYGFRNYNFYAFNLVRPHGLDNEARMRETLYAHRIECVPHLGGATLGETIAETVALARGTSLINRAVKREGLVWRDGRGLSFKVINPEFLLEYGD